MVNGKNDKFIRINATLIILWIWLLFKREQECSGRGILIDILYMPTASLGDLYCELSTYFTPCSSVSIVNYWQVNVGWVQLT